MITFLFYFSLGISVYAVIVFFIAKFCGINSMYERSIEYEKEIQDPKVEENDKNNSK
jgi:hypothetical protein